MKKLLCLMLALLMVFSLAACGGDNGNDGNDDEGGDKNPNKEPTTPTTTVPPEDDTVWVLVQETSSGTDDYYRYIYDENGNLVGGAFYADGKKVTDIQYATTPTESGGKIVEEQKKGRYDDAYEKGDVYEFDAEGRLICTTHYDAWGELSAIYTFTYNESGQLVEQVETKDGEMARKLTYVYDGNKLMEGHYWDKNENYGHYIYTYNENGVPVKADVETDYMDEQKYTLEFVEDSGYGWWRLDTTDECDNVVGGRRLFFYEEAAEYGKDPHQRNVNIKTWGVFCTGWVPMVSFGCMDDSNYFNSSVQLRYEPLEVHLAKQAENN